MDDSIAQFVAITGGSSDAARQVLEMCGGDLSSAMELWFSDPELQRNLTNPSSAGGGAPPAIPQNSRPSRRAGREDASGVIHIDSDDDDDDVDMDDVAAVAHAAQEEEDAAMARRLQEEAYGSGGGAAGGEDDGVRAPIARVTETLVAPGGYEPDDDDHAQMLEMFRQRQRAAGAGRRGGRSANPFAQHSIWDGPPAAHPDVAAEPGSSRSSSSAPTTSRAARLAELFRPPYDLMSDSEWDEARDEGKAEKKWILVNLQDMTDFNCQALNRDIWKDAPIKQLVRENFIFLQYSKDDPRAQEFIQFYFPNRSHENPSNYPHVSIVDPRTGEQVKTWSGIPFPTALEFHAQLAEFLDRYSLDPTAKNPVVKARSQKRAPVDVDRMTEEEMLEMALKNSMEAAGGSGSVPTPDVQDPDELTQSVGALDTGSKGKEAEEKMDVEEAPSQEQSAFAGIASDKPHTEPTDPATTTRIQFRHPTGRIIRRFSVCDPVSRVYEWLKAEPLEGQEGVEFELKVMPQGTNLIEKLDETIEDAGLKQATVMIEFL